MTVKQFFKSAAFKALAVLLSITVVCGGVLAVANDLFYVSEEEVNLRSYSKLLDNDKVVDDKLLTEPYASGDGVVNKVALTEKGDYLVQATGDGGYKGSVTVWVLFGFENGKFKGIKKVQYASDEGETLMANLTSAYYQNFANHNEEVLAGGIFSVDSSEGICNVVTGTTKSSTAIANAVNSALGYVRAVILGQGDNPTPEQPKLYEKNVKDVNVKISGNTVTYTLTVKALGDPDNFDFKIAVTDGKIDSFEITKNGTTDSYLGAFGKVDFSTYMVGKTYAELSALIGKDGTEQIKTSYVESGSFNTLTTGASYSCIMTLIAGAYATGNYEAYLAEGSAPAHPVYYAENVKSATQEVDGNTVTYTLTVQALGDPDNFDFKIAVTDGKIDSFEITKNGTTDSYLDAFGKVDFSTYMVGKTYAELSALIGMDGTEKIKTSYVESGSFNTLTTGASYSCIMTLIAGAYATGNYDLYV